MGSSPVLCQDEGRRWEAQLRLKRVPQPACGSLAGILPALLAALSSPPPSAPLPSISEPTGRVPKEKEKATEGEMMGWHHQFNEHSGRW